jgi:predicted YcjX-like family ATPase
MVATRTAGLDKARQFAPLPNPVRQRREELAAEFARRYIEYRHEVVLTLTHRFTVCDTLLVLADLTMLLAGGAGMYNGQTHMLRLALEYLAPGRGRLNRLFDWAVRNSTLGRLNANDVLALATARRLRLPGIRRLAFVATKADQVHEQDHDKLLALLHDLTRHLAVRGRYLGEVKAEEFVCASVESTKSLDYPNLEARLVGPSQDGDASPQRYKTSQVPEHWPDDWSEGKYRFPPVWPWMPANRDRAPRQFGLNRVLDFILDVG